MWRIEHFSSQGAELLFFFFPLCMSHKMSYQFARIGKRLFYIRCRRKAFHLCFGVVTTIFVEKLAEYVSWTYKTCVNESLDTILVCLLTKFIQYLLSETVYFHKPCFIILMQQIKIRRKSCLLLSDMNFHMLCQTTWMGEIFPTCRAGIWFLPCMSSDVYFQAARLWERLFTWRAGMRLFSCVGSDMWLQVSRCMTSVVRVGARILFVSCVGSYMTSQVCCLGKCLVTLGTREGFLLCVYSFMIV